MPQGLAVAGSEDAVGDDAGVAVGGDVAETDDEVGVGGGGHDVQRGGDGAGDVEVAVEGLAGVEEDIGAALDRALVVPAGAVVVVGEPAAAVGGDGVVGVEEVAVG